MKKRYLFLTTIFIVFCILLGAVDYSNAQAQWTPDGVGICTATNNQNNQKIVSDGAGGAIIAWEDSRSVSNADIFVQRVDNNGNVLWTSDGVAICTANNDQKSVQLISDGSGGAILAWEDYRSGSFSDIYAQRVDANGNILWTADGVAICDASLDQTSPQLMSDSSGGAILTWSDNRNGNYDIYAQRIDGNANVLWTANGVVICTTDFNQLYPQLVSDDSGGAIITWEDHRSNSYPDIYAQRIDDNGNVLWTVDGVVVCTDSYSQSSPKLVSNGNGGAIIAWADGRSGLDDIYAQSIDKNGNVLWISDGVAVCTAKDSLSSQQLVADGSGGTILTWDDYRNGNYDIYAQRINADGSMLWTPDGVTICNNDYNQISPQLVSDGSNGAIITWRDPRSSSVDIYAQRINADGNVLWTANGMAVCVANDTQSNPQLLSDGTGGTIITWQDNRNGVEDIYAQRVNDQCMVMIPNGGEYWAGASAQDIKWLARPEFPVDHVSILYSTDGGGTYPNEIIDNTPNDGSYSWIVPGLNSNTFKIKVQSKDASNGVLTEDVSDSNYTIDSTPPSTFALLSPANEAWATTSPIFTWEASSDTLAGLLKYQLWIDGAVNLDSISASLTSCTSGTPLPEGIHTWNIKAIDKAGNEQISNQTWQFIVERDTTPPVSTVTNPVSGQTLGSTSYTIAGTADDGTGTGVKIVHISVDDGATWYETQATKPDFSAWEWLWTGYAQGNYTIKSRATDVEGNVETPQPGVTVTVDVTKPSVKNIVVTPNPTSSGTIQISVEFQVGSSGLNYSSVPSISFTPKGGSAIQFVQTSYNGNIWQGSGTIDVGEKNGTAIVAVSGATDSLGNVMDPNPNAGNFIIDTYPSEAFNLIAPVDSGWVNSTLPTFSWEIANDTLTGIGKYQLWIDGILNKDDIPDSSTSAAPDQSLSLGEHTWFIKSIDKANNSRNSSSTWLFNMDFQAPISQIIAPADKDTLGSPSYSILGTASDSMGQGISGVDKVEISINDAPWQTVVNTGTDFSSWSYEWTGYATGSHTLKCRASDRAGNIGDPSSPITVYFNQSAPKIKNILVTPNPAKAGDIEITVDFEANDTAMNNGISPEVTFTPAGSQSKVSVNQTNYVDSTWVGTATVTTDMNNGTATIQVSGATNNLGNVMLTNNNAGYFIIDTAEPMVQSAIVVPSPVKAGKINVTIKFVEATSGLNTLINPSVTFTPAGGTPELFTQTGYSATEKIWTGTAIVSQAMKDGVATIQVKGAEDLAGNVLVENNNAGSFLIDVTPPGAFELLAPQDSVWISNSTPKFEWNPSIDTTTGLLNYHLFVNNNLNVSNISPNETSTLPTASLSDGVYSWFVIVHDGALNSTQSTSTWLLRIDTTPPVSKITNLTSGMSVSGDTLVIEVTANDGIGASAGCGVDSVYISFNGGNSWFPAIKAGTDFNTWKYNWTGYTNQNYTIKSKAIDLLGNKEIPGEGVAIVVTEVTSKADNQIPKQFAVSQNYPNPFNPETMINFEIPKSCQVVIKIYNTVGQEVKTLVNEKRDAGFYQISWDGIDNLGNKVGSGIYLYQLKAEEFIASKKMVMIQ